MRNPYGPDQKQCRKCGEVKAIDNFRAQQARCKMCCNERQKLSNLRIKDQILEIKRKSRAKHAERDRVEYAGSLLKQTRNIYKAMIQRCYDPNADNYERYGARGIRVCATWRESLQNFIADVGIRPSANYSIDRFPDNNGNYEPGNVRWATQQQQRANRRDSKRAA